MLAKVKNTKGFSLIELLVVIVIMGILATGAVSYFGSARAKARDGVRISTASQIGQSIMALYLDGAAYPTTGAADLISSTLTTDFGGIPLDPSVSTNFFVFFGKDNSLNYASCFLSEVTGKAKCAGDPTTVAAIEGHASVTATTFKATAGVANVPVGYTAYSLQATPAILVGTGGSTPGPG